MSTAFGRRNLWAEVYQGVTAYWRRTTTNPQWLLMAVFGRFAMVQVGVARLWRSDLPALDHQTLHQTQLTGLDLDQSLKTLKADGVCLGLNLSAKTVSNIVRAIPEERLGKSQFGYGAQYVTSQNLLLQPSAAQTVVETLRQDPILTHLAAQYMGATPIYSGSRLWWSFAQQDCSLVAPQPVNRFHYDLYDYRCLRFFFYLTDVDTQSGPHQYVRGSHRHRQLSHALAPLKACPDAKIIEYYGAERIITIQGVAGTGFAEDPFCFHKGTPPQTRNRLMLMLQYVAHDYGVTNNPRDPFAFWKSES